MAEDRTPRKSSLAEPTMERNDSEHLRERQRELREERRPETNVDHDAAAAAAQELSEKSGHEGMSSRLF